MGVWVVEPRESIELLHVRRAVTEHVLLARKTWKLKL